MDNEQKLYDDNFATEGQLKRIADALEEVLRLVKEDQTKTAKRMNGMSEEPSHTHEEIVELTK